MNRYFQCFKSSWVNTIATDDWTLTIIVYVEHYSDKNIRHQFLPKRIRSVLSTGVRLYEGNILFNNETLESNPLPCFWSTYKYIVSTSPQYVKKTSSNSMLKYWIVLLPSMQNHKRELKDAYVDKCACAKFPRQYCG